VVACRHQREDVDVGVVGGRRGVAGRGVPGPAVEPTEADRRRARLRPGLQIGAGLHLDPDPIGHLDVVCVPLDSGSVSGTQCLRDEELSEHGPHRVHPQI
jgi:hypothetical protein